MTGDNKNMEGGDLTGNSLQRGLLGAINAHNLSRNGIVIASGQLPNAKTTLYTVPTGFKLKVTFLYLCNDDGSSRTPLLYVDASGTSRKFFTKVMLTKTTEKVIEGGTVLDLEEGDLLEGSCDAANVVDYVITGTLIQAED